MQAQQKRELVPNWTWLPEDFGWAVDIETGKSVIFWSKIATVISGLLGLYYIYLVLRDWFNSKMYALFAMYKRGPWADDDRFLAVEKRCREKERAKKDRGENSDDEPVPELIPILKLKDAPKRRR